MSKFEGQASISSADFFGGGPGSSSSRQGGRNDYLDQGPDLDEIRASVRQGVNKVAGRLSNIANGVMNSIQVSIQAVQTLTHCSFAENCVNSESIVI